MTHTQAGFVLANEAKPDPRIAPLAKAMEAKRAELIAQPLSFIWNELAQVALAATPIVPAPTYRVKNRDIKELWVAHGGSQHGPRVETYTIPEVAFWKFIESLRERLSSASVEEADAKEAAGETYYTKGKGAEHFERLSDKDFAWALTCAAQDLNDSDENVSEWMPVTALLDGAAERIRANLLVTTIPSEPDAKREAGAGPVGETVASQAAADICFPHEAWQVAGHFFETREEAQKAADSHDLWAEPKQPRAWLPASARLVEEPGEVERLTRERDAAMKAATHWRDRYCDAATAFDRPDLEQRLTVHRRIDAEAALAETRERLEQLTSERNNALAAAKMLTGSLSSAQRALAEARALLDYITQTDRNNDGYRIVDMCFTAFMAAKKPNTEDGGPSDWMEDTRPLVLEGLADIRRRAALPTQESSAALAGDGKEAGK